MDVSPNNGAGDTAAGTVNVGPAAVLTLHGQSREIVFPVAISKDHSLYSIDGDARLDTRDFGLPILHTAIGC